MSIHYAILGLLSWRPATGYDLKKLFEASPTLHWSGNNNQIYKSLVKLLDDRLVTNTIHHQESAPSKKIYSITEEGRARLKEWVLSEPDLPELKHTFLIQLAWADQLNDEELLGVLANYEQVIRLQLVYQQEQRKRGIPSPDRSEREAFLWSKISDNLVSYYQNELEWLQGVRHELLGRKQVEERSTMEYKVVKHEGGSYVEVLSSPVPLRTEQDAVDLVALCMEHQVELLLLHRNVLAEDFYALRTGIAGQMIQKWINYHVKTAAVAPIELIQQGKFKEMAAESNKSNHFGIFESEEEAGRWLLQ